jgi:hypothetical protein
LCSGDLQGFQGRSENVKRKENGKKKKENSEEKTLKYCP